MKKWTHIIDPWRKCNAFFATLESLLSVCNNYGQFWSEQLITHGNFLQIIVRFISINMCNVAICLEYFHIVYLCGHTIDECMKQLLGKVFQ